MTHPNGWLPALSPNIRLGWKCVTLANTVAYFKTAQITVVKKFYSTGLGVNIIKRFSFVTNDLKNK